MGKIKGARLPARSFGSGEVRWAARGRPEVGKIESQAFESLGFNRRDLEETGDRVNLRRGRRRQAVELQAQAAMFLRAMVLALLQVTLHFADTGRICGLDMEMRQVLTGRHQQRHRQQAAQIDVQASGAHGGMARSLSGGFPTGNSPIIAAIVMAQP